MKFVRYCNKYSNSFDLIFGKVYAVNSFSYQRLLKIISINDEKDIEQFFVYNEIWFEDVTKEVRRNKIKQLLDETI